MTVICSHSLSEVLSREERAAERARRTPVPSGAPRGEAPGPVCPFLQLGTQGTHVRRCMRVCRFLNTSETDIYPWGGDLAHPQRAMSFRPDQVLPPHWKSPSPWLRGVCSKGPGVRAQGRTVRP